ncbi:MAG: TIGR03790 family protein [Opitutales bacterium]
MRRRLSSALLVLLVLGAGPLPVLPAEAGGAGAKPDLAARTVILVNAREPESVELGEFYAAQRGIPTDNLIALPMPAEEDITWRRFIDEVWQPLQDELMRRGWIEGFASRSLDQLGRRKVSCTGHRIAYLVVCRGTPLRIQHDPTNEPPGKVPSGFPQGFRTNQGAVDSELSLLAFGNYEISGFIVNPLYGREHPHSVGADLIVKVSRLDGPSDAAARHLITSALEAEQHGLAGRTYVDLMLKGAPHPDGDRWLEAAAGELDRAGFDGTVDRQPGVFDLGVRFDAPAVYLGWYAGEMYGPFLRPGFQFPPGAIALHIHSFSAHTLRSDRAGWCGPLVARGAAATVGNVYEPYLQMTHRPDLLIQALLRGETLGDAAYYALPCLSWQAIVIGDPLYRPFRLPFDEQRRQLGQLPAGLAPYVVLREARLLELAGKGAEAGAIRQAGLRHYPGLVLALAQAKAALAAQRPVEALAVLDAEALAPASVGGELWPLWREAAQLLDRAGAHDLALTLDRRLLHESPPSPAAQEGVLDEARQAAEAAGDREAAKDFARQLEKMRAPPALAPVPARPK